MRRSMMTLAAAVFAAGLALTACSSDASDSTSGTPGSDGSVITPVVKDAGELAGTTIELTVGQVLSINTGDLAVDSYEGTVADSDVAEFVAGYEQDGATFNPGVRGLAPGSTSVTLTNSDGGIEDVDFTVEVTDAQ